MRFWDAAKIELFKTVLTLLTLAVGWLLGQRIVAYWDLKKKRQELDIATATQFHKLYGEFKEVSRLWRSYCHPGTERKLDFPESTPLELLKRASAAEGGIEAIMVKLSTERILTAEDIKQLGLFRQAFQKLREAIRAHRPFRWTYGTPEYLLFNELASQTACIISNNKFRKPSQLPAPSVILAEIAAVRSAEWNTHLGKKELPSEYFRAGAGAVIINDKGLVLACERAEMPGAWQLPQGGLAVNEEPRAGALREIREETGIPADQLELLDTGPHPLVYELPRTLKSEKTGRGQVQCWFLFRFTGSDELIDLTKSPELRAWKWMTLTSLTASVVAFRKPIYQQLEQWFASRLSQ